MSIIEKLDSLSGNINTRYDMKSGQIDEIYNYPCSKYDGIHYGFVLGYTQGVKAERNGKGKARKEINNKLDKLSDEELGKVQSLLNKNQRGIIPEQKEIATPIWAYKGEILRLLKAIWKLDDVKLFQIIYTNIKVYAKHRGIEV